MALFVYPTDVMLDDAQRQGVGPEQVKQFCDQIEKDQSVSTFDRFPPPYLTRKRKWDYNNRLIAAEHSVGDHLIIILLRLLVKSSRDYEVQFAENPHAYADPLLSKAVPKAELWLKERTTIAPAPELRQPSREEELFLWSETAESADRDATVCETQQWIESISDSRVRDRLILLPDVLIGLAQGDDTGPQIKAPVNDPGLRIAYRWFPGEKRLLLLDIARDRELDAEHCFAQCTRNFSGQQLDVLRITRRSYPVEVCCDKDMWIAIQRDAASNMALSPEEAKILQSVRVSNQIGFPLFINGRAGSGKSTLLQYLFAGSFEAWVKHLRQSRNYLATIPLYFAASQELLTAAKSAVKGLLSINADRIAKGVRFDGAILDLLDHAFRRPSEYLVKSVRSLGTTTDFERSRHVNYQRFRQLWTEQFGREPRARRDYGPQLSWHVVRTHIKGQSVDAELEPEDFGGLPRNEQTVSQERYRMVYQRVWEAWYKPLCKERAYWDDQDLAAEAAACGLHGQHAALFCDEAQDFTRRQLEALHRCCGFSFLQLTPAQATRVPFVFAGDPFQTLNPTGFRWEAIRAAFTEKIAGNLYRYKRRAHLPEINYQELTFNYRSSQHVVKLCNSIQAVRAIVMQEGSLRPQTTWLLDRGSPPPVFFNTNESTVADAIRQQSDLVLIVPSEEDDESEYVKQHSAINSIVQRDADGIPQNVLSPARAKGLEFNRVAVVGFASTPEALELAKCIADPTRLSELSPDQLLPIEYFLNKLYVACSRARHRLFIIDTPADMQQLWAFVLDHEKLQRLCDLLPAARDIWRESVGQIAKGLPEHWQDHRNDPRETASGFEEDGKAKRDPYLLRQAALQYDLAGDRTRTLDCRAVAYEFEGKYREAGALFEQAGNSTRALEAFWEGEAFDRVIAVVSNDPSLSGRDEFRLASFLNAKNPQPADAEELLRQIVSQLAKEPNFKDKLLTKGWMKAVRGLLDGASKAAANANDSTMWFSLADIHTQLTAYGIAIDAEIRADALLGAKKYDEVIDLLRLKPESKVFRKAKCAALVRERTSGRGDKISIEDRKLAGDVLREQGQYEASAEWYEEAESFAGLESDIESLAGRSDGMATKSVLESLIRLGVKLEDWGGVLSILDGSRWRKLTPAAATLLREKTREADLVRKMLIPAVASADSTLREPASIRDRLLELVRAPLTYPMNDWKQERIREVRCQGAAVERVGKDIDAQGFYEGQFKDDSVPDDLRDYCNRRWIQCKLRQQTRERARDRKAQADRLKEQAEGRMRTFNWTTKDLGPDFPDKALLVHGYEKQSRLAGPPTDFVPPIVEGSGGPELASAYAAAAARATADVAARFPVA